MSEQIKVGDLVMQVRACCDSINDHPDLGLNAGDDCPKCSGELHVVKHRFQEDGGHPDCSWLACLDCDYATDPE